MNETEQSDGSTARSAAPTSPSLTLLKGPLPRSLFGSNASILGAHGGAAQIEAYGAMNETERSDGSTARSAAPTSPSLTLLKGPLPRSLFGSNASILGAHGGAAQIEAYGAMNETEQSDGSTARSAAPSIPSLTLLKGPLPRSLFGSSASVLGAHGGAVQIEAYGAHERDGAERRLYRAERGPLDPVTDVAQGPPPAFIVWLQRQRPGSAWRCRADRSVWRP